MTVSEVYIDQTGRTVEHRLKEHRRTLVSGDVNLSAVTQHAVDEGHDIDWSSATVIDGHPNFHQRCALEAWHIRAQDSPPFLYCIIEGRTRVCTLLRKTQQYQGIGMDHHNAMIWYMPFPTYKHSALCV